MKSILRIAGALALLVSLHAPVQAQVPGQPSQRVVRGYIPPDQLVSFLPSTSFDTFIELLNPTFARVTGKTIIDPESRSIPIGIPITTMHFFDALSQVLYYNKLAYRETDKYFIIGEQPPPDLSAVSGVTGAAAGAVGATGSSATGSSSGQAAQLPATLATRQVRINAVLFELNHTKSKEVGLDWSSVLGSQNSSGSSGGGSTSGGSSGSSGSQSSNRLQLFLKSDKMFKGVQDLIETPDRINFSSINSIIRFAEATGLGETVASPEVSVQSGIKGSMQVGSDVPVLTRDFQGNTQTEFFKTGIIIDVTPTIISQATADTVGAPVVDFIHLDVKVEKSGSRPTAAGITIDRSNATTQLAVLDGEQIIIGGLYSTDETFSRSGIPFLKDLPPWFFGLRYIFGRETRSVSKKELIIVLEAHIIDPILERMARGLPENMMDQRRRQVQEALERFNARVADQHAGDIKYGSEKND